VNVIVNVGMTAVTAVANMASGKNIPAVAVLYTRDPGLDPDQDQEPAEPARPPVLTKIYAHVFVHVPVRWSTVTTAAVGVRHNVGGNNNKPAATLTVPVLLVLFIMGAACPATMGGERAVPPLFSPLHQPQLVLLANMNSRVVSASLESLGSSALSSDYQVF